MNFSWTSPKTKVGDSGLKGRGLFAIAPISKGEFVAVDGGQIVSDYTIDTPSFQAFADICYQVELGFHLCPGELDLAKLEGTFLMNHSCDPTCGLRGQVTFVALRDILPGEEITYDYVMTDANYPGMNCKPQQPMDCFCGAKNCRRIITGDDWKKPELQKKYKGHFSPYLQELINKINAAS